MPTRFKRRKKARIKATTKSKELPKNFFSIFKKEALIASTDLTKGFAKELAKEAKQIIRQQKYNWEPLSDAYALRKKKLGLDERILMATREYVNKGIGWWEQDGKIFVGPKPGEHSKAGVSYLQLSRWLEYGTWKMPARPLWRPLLSSVLRRRPIVKARYKKAVERGLRKQKKRAKTRTRKV